MDQSFRTEPDKGTHEATAPERCSHPRLRKEAATKSIV